MDQDWYKLNTTNAGIYQFDIPTPATNMPIVELYEIAEGKDEKESLINIYLMYLLIWTIIRILGLNK